MTVCFLYACVGRSTQRPLLLLAGCRRPRRRAVRRGVARFASNSVVAKGGGQLTDGPADGSSLPRSQQMRANCTMDCADPRSFEVDERQDLVDNKHQPLCELLGHAGAVRIFVSIGRPAHYYYTAVEPIDPIRALPIMALNNQQQQRGGGGARGALAKQRRRRAVPGDAQPRGQRGRKRRSAPSVSASAEGNTAIRSLQIDVRELPTIGEANAVGRVVRHLHCVRNVVIFRRGAVPTRMPRSNGPPRRRRAAAGSWRAGRTC
jgi:hypothetical protein